MMVKRGGLGIVLKITVYALLSFALFSCAKQSKEDVSAQVSKHIKDGEMYFSKREFPQALDNWEKALALQPKENSYLYNNIGIVYYMFLKQPEKAKEQWEAEIEVNPDDYLGYMGLGNYYKDTRKFDMAVDHYKKSIELKPDYFMSYQNLGEAYISMKEYDKAKETIEKSIKLMSHNAPGYHILGRVYMAQNKLEQAESAWKKALSFMPRMAVVSYELGKLYDKKNQVDIAARHLKTAIKNDPNFASPYNYLANMYAERGINLGEAEKMVQKAIELQEEGRHVFLDTLGWVYFKQGKLGKAEENIRKAIEKTEAMQGAEDNILAEEYYHLGMVLAVSGKVKEAEESLDKAVKNSKDYLLNDKINKAKAELNSKPAVGQN